MIAKTWTSASARVPRRRPDLRQRTFNIVMYVFMTVLAVCFLVPLIWMVVSSLKSEGDIAANPLSFVAQEWLFGNYATAFEAVSPFLWNSVKLAAFNVVGVLVVASLAGYAFGRLDFWGRDVIFKVVLATSIVPYIVYLVPQYIMFQNMGWIDTHYPLWAPRVFTPVFATFLLRQAFKTLPQELEDAARIDGAGAGTTFWRIMLPQVKPALAAVGVFTFIESWNDLFGPLIFINSTELQTLPLALAQFHGEFFNTTNLLMAASSITIVPVLLVFFAAQRYFVQGITSTGLKG